MDSATKASIMSCQAMMILTREHYEKNINALQYHMICPTDSKIDYDRNSITPHDSLCFTHDPTLKQGVYSKQIENTKTEQFDTWTRKKIAIKPQVFTNEIIKDLDYEYYNCQINHHVPCGIHPTPCRNK